MLLLHPPALIGWPADAFLYKIVGVNVVKSFVKFKSLIARECRREGCGGDSIIIDSFFGESLGKWDFFLGGLLLLLGVVVVNSMTPNDDDDGDDDDGEDDWFSSPIVVNDGISSCISKGVWRRHTSLCCPNGDLDLVVVEVEIFADEECCSSGWSSSRVADN